MEIEYKGANCVVIKTKKTSLVIDPKVGLVGLKDQIGRMRVVLATQDRFAVAAEDSVLLDGPGEYEIGDISAKGIPAQVYSDTPDDGKRATMYRLYTNEVSIAVVGHVTSPLSEDQLEGLGVVDIAIVPIGGNGYTLDAHAAIQVVRQLAPKIVIPTHYADPNIKYEVPQMEIDNFIKELGVTTEETPRLKLKNGVINDTLTVVVVQRTA